jgi:hypothetical protein
VACVAAAACVREAGAEKKKVCERKGGLEK